MSDSLQPHGQPHVHEIFQARILEWVAMPSSRGSFWPRGQSQVFSNSGRFFTIWATKEAQVTYSLTGKWTQAIAVKVSNPNNQTTREGLGFMTLSRFNRVQLFVTPWTVPDQAPLPMGFSRQEYWSGFPCPPSGDLPDPGIEPMSVTSPALASRAFCFLFFF